MKEKFILKYISPSFSQQLLDKWNRLTQANKSATDYITKFDEYLNRCGATEFESPKQTLSRFRSGHRGRLPSRAHSSRHHDSKEACQLVTDLNESRGSYFHQSDFRDSSKTTTASKPSYSRSFPTPSKPAPSSSSIKLACSSSVKPVGSSSTKLTTFEKKTASEPAKVIPRTQCYRCQGYGHLASQWPSQTKTLLVKIPIKDVEEDGLEVIVHQ